MAEFCAAYEERKGELTPAYRLGLCRQYFDGYALHRFEDLDRLLDYLLSEVAVVLLEQEQPLGVSTSIGGTK